MRWPSRVADAVDDAAEMREDGASVAHVAYSSSAVAIEDPAATEEDAEAVACGRRRGLSRGGRGGRGCSGRGGARSMSSSSS